MKKACLLLLVLGAFGSHTQAPVPPASTVHADSVATLRQVFRHARRHARFGARASGLVLGAQAMSFTSDRTTSSPARVTLGVSISALYTYFFGGLGTGLGRFSRRREEVAVHRWDLHQPQPPYIQHRLVFASRK